MDKDLLLKFRKNVVLPISDIWIGCWIWTGDRNKGGYGWIQNKKGKHIMAHRMSWEIYYGEIPSGLDVLHHCDRPICVNPYHLFLGTCSDNMKDMWNKHRHPIINMGRPSFTMIGERNIKSRLKEKDVMRIRTLYADGISLKELSLLFGVKKPAIWKIVNNYTWKYLE
jgi:hypothetical protein